MVKRKSNYTIRLHINTIDSAIIKIAAIIAKLSLERFVGKLCNNIPTKSAPTNSPRISKDRIVATLTVKSFFSIKKYAIATPNRCIRGTVTSGNVIKA